MIKKIANEQYYLYCSFANFLMIIVQELLVMHFRNTTIICFTCVLIAELLKHK